MKQTIEIPEGFELKKVSDTEYQIVKKEEKLPETWEEFCKTHNKTNRDCFINACSNIESFENEKYDSTRDRNLLPNKQYGEAILALMQLIQLRDCYRQGWKPDWDNSKIKHVIRIDRSNLLAKEEFSMIPFIFSFQTAELRDKFFNNFKELLNTASYLWK